MQYLTEENIIGSVDEYIKNANANYAIMISGNWGVGKTFFIKNSIIPFVKKKAIYVSLFGALNAEDISTRIYSSVIESRVGEKLLPVLNIGVKIVSEIVSSKMQTDFSKGIKKETFSPFINYSMQFFIFDDLERTSMQINDVLGFINYFVEQNNAKVLIVGNDIEMGNMQGEQTDLLKYIIAGNNKIDWNIGLDIDTSESNSNNNEKINLKEIERRINLVYDKKSHYKKIREKLIGRTFFYRPNLDNVIKTLYGNIIQDDVSISEFHQESITKIAEVMKNHDYYNLRTAQFIIAFYLKIIDDCAALLEDRLYEDVMKVVLNSIIYVSIEHKNGASMPSLSDDEFMLTAYPDKEMQRVFGDTFRFVYEYVYYGIYSKDRVIDVISEYKEYYNKKTYNQTLESLKSYWEMEDDEINMKINYLYEEFVKNKARGFDYELLISLLLEIKIIGLEPVPIKSFVMQMKENLMNYEFHGYYTRSGTFDKTDILKQYNEILAELRDSAAIKKVNSHKENIETIMNSGSGWGNNFTNYYFDNRYKLMGGALFHFLDIEKTVKLVKLSSIRDVSDFRRCFYDVLLELRANENPTRELMVLKTLREGLLDEFSGVIRKHNIKLFLEEIDSTLAYHQYN